MLKAKKSFGQNFLSDPAILNQIIVFAEVKQGENVLEIGPGHGALTEQLLQAGAVVQAIELDADLLPALTMRFSGNTNFTLREGDILTTPLKDFYPEGEPYKVVANIPYYITAPIVRKLLTERPTAQSVTLLVQKEVAERLAGGSKNRSILTVSAQYYSQVVLGPLISKKYFTPVPKVDSQLVTLLPKRAFSENDQFFFRIVKIGFAARRKTLFNNLVAGQLLTKEEAEEIFVSFGWTKERRAQELEIEEWEQLSFALTKKEK